MERRLGPDRRRFPRGGRRDGDAYGLSPLVMVVEPDATRRALTDMVLTMGRFAVVPVASIDGALAVCRGLMPAVIVCDDTDVTRLREGLGTLIVPVVPSPPDDGAPGDLIERIRRAVRGGSAATVI